MMLLDKDRKMDNVQQQNIFYNKAIYINVEHNMFRLLLGRHQLYLTLY
jgi:hypothetical protein